MTLHEATVVDALAVLRAEIERLAGGLRVEAVDEPLPRDLSGQLAQLVAEGGQAQELPEVVWQLCADYDSALRAPAAPLTELALAGGLSLSPHTREQVAPSGFDWDTIPPRGWW